MTHRVRILNVDVDDIVEDELLAQLDSGMVMTVNIDFIMRMQRDRAFWEIHRSADYVVPDGQLVVFASRLLGTPLRQRVAGADFFRSFYRHHRDNPDVRIFVLGAGPGVAAEVMRRVNGAVGRQIVVGAFTPTWGFENDMNECRRIVSAINASGATVLAIGVGAPKQEKWIERWRSELPAVRIFLPIGATLDFEAGRIRRAPRLLQRIGLEWLFRLGTEPRRLWRRYLVDDMPFFWLLFRQLFGSYRDPYSADG